ncbi:MAG: AMP-binding protein [Chitinivibrionales bacterium]|nr:AMP-binding protein [Chitinivibrionales bacterium]
MVFRPELSWEFLSSDEINARTLRALRNHVRHLKEVSPHYKERLKDVAPDDIGSFEHFQQLPLTGKKELVSRTDTFLGVSEEHIVETVVTSGSTGRPLIFSLTASDLDRLAYNEALCFHGAGVSPADRAQIFVSLDRLFIAGIAYYRGLTLLGTNTARIGVLPPDMQLHYLETLKPSVIVGVPSFLRKLAAELDDRNFDTRNSSITRLICIGESIRTQDMQLNALGKSLEETYRSQVFSTYGNTELSIAYCECTAQCGGHAHPELIYTEIVDENGNVVPDGTPGELVATSLGVEGIPLLRYKTGDITFRMSDACACGRNACRIGPILARKAQMIKIKGTSVYPSVLTNVLDEFDEIDDFCIVLEGDASSEDQIKIHAALAPEMTSVISERLRARARVSLPILVSNAATIQSMRGESRKKVRIIDKRKQPTR